MIIDDQVYDVTDYVDIHPGKKSILNGCGVDATEMFNSRGGEGTHSPVAKALKENYLIGSIVQ